MNNIARLKKAAELYREYEKFQKRLAKFSVNGHKPKKVKKENQLRGSYMGLVGKLPKKQKDEIRRIFQEQGVRAAIKAAQAAVEGK